MLCSIFGTCCIQLILCIFRVAGNSAYIIGTLAESELGCMRILSLAKGSSKESKKILPDLTTMLTFDDSESVMNAAGTMGTLVCRFIRNLHLYNNYRIYPKYSDTLNVRTPSFFLKRHLFYVPYISRHVPFRVFLLPVNVRTPKTCPLFLIKLQFFTT